MATVRDILGIRPEIAALAAQLGVDLEPSTSDEDQSSLDGSQSDLGNGSAVIVRFPDEALEQKDFELYRPLEESSSEASDDDKEDDSGVDDATSVKKKKKKRTEKIEDRWSLFASAEIRSANSGRALLGDLLESQCYETGWQRPGIEEAEEISQRYFDMLEEEKRQESDDAISQLTEDSSSLPRVGASKMPEPMSLFSFSAERLHLDVFRTDKRMDDRMKAGPFQGGKRQVALLGLDKDTFHKVLEVVSTHGLAKQWLLELLNYQFPHAFSTAQNPFALVYNRPFSIQQFGYLFTERMFYAQKANEMWIARILFEHCARVTPAADLSLLTYTKPQTALAPTMSVDTLYQLLLDEPLLSPLVIFENTSVIAFSTAQTRRRVIKGMSQCGLFCVPQKEEFVSFERIVLLTILKPPRRIPFAPEWAKYARSFILPLLLSRDTFLTAMGFCLAKTWYLLHTNVPEAYDYSDGSYRRLRESVGRRETSGVLVFAKGLSKSGSLRSDKTMRDDMHSPYIVLRMAKLYADMLQQYNDINTCFVAQTTTMRHSVYSKLMECNDATEAAKIEMKATKATSAAQPSFSTRTKGVRYKGSSRRRKDSDPKPKSFFNVVFGCDMQDMAQCMAEHKCMWRMYFKKLKKEFTEKEIEEKRRWLTSLGFTVEVPKYSLPHFISPLVRYVASTHPMLKQLRHPALAMLTDAELYAMLCGDLSPDMLLLVARLRFEEQFEGFPLLPQFDEVMFAVREWDFVYAMGRKELVRKAEKMVQCRNEYIAQIDSKIARLKRVLLAAGTDQKAAEKQLQSDVITLLKQRVSKPMMCLVTGIRSPSEVTMEGKCRPKRVHMPFVKTEGWAVLIYRRCAKHFSAKFLHPLEEFNLLRQLPEKLVLYPRFKEEVSADCRRVAAERVFNVTVTPPLISMERIQDLDPVNDRFWRHRIEASVRRKYDNVRLKLNGSRLDMEKRLIFNYMLVDELPPDSWDFDSISQQLFIDLAQASKHV